MKTAQQTEPLTHEQMVEALVSGRRSLPSREWANDELAMAQERLDYNRERLAEVPPDDQERRGPIQSAIAAQERIIGALQAGLGAVDAAADKRTADDLCRGYRDLIAFADLLDSSPIGKMSEL